MKCKYYKLCQYYSKDFPSCNDKSGESGYCGLAREYEKLDKIFNTQRVSSKNRIRF